jgi:hypothetical protein
VAQTHFQNSFGFNFGVTGGGLDLLVSHDCESLA